MGKADCIDSGGTGLGVSDDIIGTTRDASPDIGAFELVAAILIKFANEIVNINGEDETAASIYLLDDENLDISETSSLIKVLLQYVSDVVNSVESSTVVRVMTRVVSETINIVSGFIRSRALVRLFNETQRLVESTIVGRALLRLVNETMNIVEIVLSQKVLVRIISESISMAETFVSKLQGMTLIATTTLVGSVKRISQLFGSKS